MWHFSNKKTFSTVKCHLPENLAIKICSKIKTIAYRKTLSYLLAFDQAS